VFDRIVRNAARLCQSVPSAVYRRMASMSIWVAHDQFFRQDGAAVAKPTLPRSPATI